MTMEKIVVPFNSDTTKKYNSLLRTINEMEKSIRLTEISYVFINVIIVLFSVNYITSFFNTTLAVSFTLEASLIMICLFSGMIICTFWTALITRMQLKLKLRYFQARFLERKMNCVGECILSDESLFFTPSIRKVESPDNKELLDYPIHGPLRLDGFIGSIRPGYLSLMMPFTFFLMYLILSIRVIIRLLA